MSNDNMALWNVLAKTDPKHVKPFKRAGGFSGTAIKPIWIVRNLTNLFGPVGKGWGMGRPVFQTHSGHNGEVLVYCTVECWHTTPENVFHGVGGDKVVSYVKANEQYRRPERWENDDEAFKKAFTDAVGNAFKFLGVGADVHMGQFDDSKYVADMEREFAPKPDPAPKRGLDGPHTSKAALFKAFTALQSDVARCGDDDTLAALLATDDAKATIEQCERDAPHYLHGGEGAPDDFEPLYTRINRMRDEFQLENA